MSHDIEATGEETSKCNNCGIENNNEYFESSQCPQAQQKKKGVFEKMREEMRF